jgi:penicillin-binding protein 2
VYRALAESCDVFFYQVGEKLGVDRIAHYARALGLGEPTGIELDHEARGLIPTAAWKKKRFGSSWMAGETLSIAIGQGYNLTTPLQMAVLTSAIANKGVRVTPRILHRVDNPDESETERKTKPSSARVPVKKQALEIVKKGLWEVVNLRNGTAWSSRIAGIHMSGKTGTAQVISRRLKANDPSVPKTHKPHAWFVAYAPSEDPKIVLSVIVEHGEGGSSKAAPIAAALIRAYLEEMHASPEISEQNLQRPY